MARVIATLVQGPRSYTVKGMRFRRGVPVPVTNNSLVELLRRNRDFSVVDDPKYRAELKEKSKAEKVEKKKARKPEPPPPPEPDEDEDDEVDEEDDDDEESDEEQAPVRSELEGMAKPELRALAKRHDIDIEGKPSKAELVERILGAFD